MPDRCSYSQCPHPDKIIYDYQAKVFPVTGYEKTRQQGGQNHVLRKTRVDGYVWHERCWEEAMKKRDGTGDQQSLL